MKQIKFTTQLAVLLCMVCNSAFPQEGHNYDFEVDGFYYNYNDGANGSTVSLTYEDYNGLIPPDRYSGTVVIPQKVTYAGHEYTITRIGDYVFDCCHYLYSVTIPLSVTSIGHHAFCDCTSLTSITIPNNVTSIEWATFYGCTSLTSFVIPNSVTTIGEGAFAGCSALYSLTLSNSLTSIQDGAFENCSNLFSIIIPNSVITIGRGVFRGCSNLYEVTVGNSIKSIDSEAFSDCQNLSSVYITDLDAWCGIKFKDKSSNPLSYQKPEQMWISGKPLYKSPQLYINGQAIEELVIPNSATGIGDFAFYGCNYLSSVDIANSVKTIGNNSFSNCDVLSSVIIPNSVTLIGDGAFEGCFNLTTVTIPSSVTSIGNSAFSRCEKVASLLIPNSVTSIGNGAFSYCTSLAAITIPYSVVSIGDRPLSGCSNLTSIVVESGNTIYNSDNNCNAIIQTETGKLIAGCKNTTIPSTVNSIEERAFESVSGLTAITIPNSVKEIGEYAFAWCSDLASITFSSNVVRIGRDAFAGTAWYKNQSDGLIYAGSVVCGYKGIIPSSVAVKEGTLGIAAWAFQGCTTLQSINLPNSLTNIGEEAFMGCRGLLSLSIPSAVTSIEDYAFWQCSGLSSIDIPNSVTFLGIGAFRECSGLTSVTIGNSLTSIEAWTFSGCTYLTSIVIPNSVTTIGNVAFNQCVYLSSIIIPSNVTTIGDMAFADCNNLSSVTAKKEVPVDITSNVFTNAANATLYVPYGCKAAYEVADYWKEFKEIVEIQPELTDKETLSVEDVNTKSGSTVEMAINLTNESEDLTAYQFDLILPDGISLSVNDKGKYVVSKTSRYEDDSQTLNASKVGGSENTYRFISFSMSNEVITGTSGAILNAALAVGESVSEGSYEATITNIVFTKTDGTQLKLNDAEFNIVVTNVIPGDANGDGEVNVTDIVEIVNYIMEKPSDRFVAAAADLNGDGEINVTDIVKVVSIIMSAGANAPQRVSALEMVDNDQLTLAVNDRVYSLHLDNEAQYVASQFEIRLGEGQTLEGVRLNGNRSDGHQVTYAKTGSNLYKVVVFSAENRPFSGNSGELLSFKVSGNGSIEVSNILFVTSGETEKLFPSLSAGTTGIDVTKTSDAMDVYSIDGRMVRRQVTSTKGLGKGMYIINGKKTIVK